MSVAVRKVEGVESIDVSLEKAVADIRLKRGNRVTLAQLRAAIKKNGYATRDADVEARGKIVLSNGTAVLDLVNGSTIPLDRAPKEGATDQIVQISGVARNGAGGDMLADIKVR